MEGGKANCEVDDWSKYDRGQYTRGYLRYHLAKEVSTHRVHVVVDLSQEDRSLIWEDQDDVLNGVEGNGHGYEEKCTVSVLDSLDGPINIWKEHDSKDGCDDSD